jgi:hypothetical protein
LGQDKWLVNGKKSDIKSVIMGAGLDKIEMVWGSLRFLSEEAGVPRMNKTIGATMPAMKSGMTMMFVAAGSVGNRSV